jgi:hypothetical protein
MEKNEEPKKGSYIGRDRLFNEKAAGDQEKQGSFYKYWTRSKTILLEREIGYLSRSIINDRC